MVPDDDILDAIRTHIAEHGYSPTIRELCDAVGIMAPSAMKYRLDMLKERGLVTFDYYKPRTIRVVE